MSTTTDVNRYTIRAKTHYESGTYVSPPLKFTTAIHRPLPPVHRLCQLLRVADEPEEGPPADYETAKEWEFDASAKAMLSIKPDVEQLPLFNPRGQQVGIGVGLIWSVDEKGEPQWHFEDDSCRCVDHQSCWEEICENVEDDL